LWAPHGHDRYLSGLRTRGRCQRALRYRGCAARSSCCAISSGSWAATRRCGATTSGWWTPQPFVLLLGLWLHLVCTLHGLPVTFALTGAKADERQVLLELLVVEPQLVATRPGASRDRRQALLRPGVRAASWRAGRAAVAAGSSGEAERPGAQLFKPLRQLIEPVNQIFKGQLDLGSHGGRTSVGVAFRMLQPILGLTAVIWHNDKTGQPTLRSLVACGH
jgi:hypothetical protein